MLKRFYKALGIVAGVVLLLVGLCTIPIWIVVWVITGFNLEDLIRWVIDPGVKKRVAKINADTERINAETERIKEEIAQLQRENEEQERIRREMDRLKGSN